jgi:type IV pilus assembly protein PilB
MQNSAPPIQNSLANTSPTGKTNPAVSVKGMGSILDALLAKGIITSDQFNSFKFEAINSGKSLEDIIRNHNIISSDEIAKLKAEMRGIGFADLSNMVVNIEVLNKLNAEQARSNLAIVFEEMPNRFKVGMKDPLDLQRLKYLESLLGKSIEAFYSSEDDILNIIDTKYGAQIGKEVDEALEEVGDNTIDLNSTNFSDVGEANLEDAPIIKIVNMIMEFGVKNKASDIHIEPREKKIAVRFRIRGILTEKLTIPRKLLSPVVTRIKILSNLKIDEHRVPQDGRFQIKGAKNRVDVRVSVMPSIYGEKIVMRLLEKTEGVLSLEDLGMRGISLQRYTDALKRTQGVLLVSGPTGSGKTQSLASSLKILNTPEVNIVTLEDPVEIRVEGVNQVQVNAEVGLTFATGLRSFLRQDPDIIMVGEIRDSETAGLAIQAALVGRLVLSTIHTNSSSGAFVRLIDMGLEPFLLASTVNVIVAQRLVRVLCDCKQPYEASPEILKELHSQLDLLNGLNVYDEDHNLKVHFDRNTDKITLYKAVGCPKCNDSGYISRTGIFEVLKMSETISRSVMRRASIKEVQDIAISEGMVTMVQDGYIKAIEGITTLEEIFRVKNE